MRRGNNARRAVPHSIVFGTLGSEKRGDRRPHLSQLAALAALASRRAAFSCICLNIWNRIASELIEAGNIGGLRLGPQRNLLGCFNKKVKFFD
jgi:hypothetical protein